MREASRWALSPAGEGGKEVAKQFLDAWKKDVACGTCKNYRWAPLHSKRFFMKLVDEFMKRRGRLMVEDEEDDFDAD